MFFKKPHKRPGHFLCTSQITKWVLSTSWLYTTTVLSARPLKHTQYLCPLEKMVANGKLLCASTALVAFWVSKEDHEAVH